MNKYFAFKWKHEPELASAFALQGTKLDHELINDLDGKMSMPFDFELRKVTEGKDGLATSLNLSGLKETWLDYQPNDLAWPLMSEKLKAVFEKNLTGNEGVDWITTNVKANGQQKLYYILRFTKKLDVLDKKNTKYVPGTDQILRAYFLLSNISTYSVFHDELTNNLWKITPFINISEALKKEIQKERLTGIEFEKIGNITA